MANRAHKAAVEFLHKISRDLPALKNGNPYKLELVFDHIGHLGGGVWRIHSAEFYTTADNPKKNKSPLIIQ